MRSDKFWASFDDFARSRLGARGPTFAKMFEHLDTFDRPVTIAETGCCRRDPSDDESWKGDGCSTVLFDRYVSCRDDGSLVGSIDLDPEAVRLAISYAPNAAVSQGDSVEWLRAAAGSMLAVEYGGVDLLYLDSFDYKPSDPLPSAVHHHAELMAAMPMVRSDTLVVVDDAWAAVDDQGRVEVGGKGFLVARHMVLCGADMEFCQYQSGWTKVGPARARVDEDLQEIVDRARRHVENDRAVAAEQIYRLILGVTTPPDTGRKRVAHGEACAFYARLALARQRFGAGADWYREAIQADPLATDYRIELTLNCFIPMAAWKPALVEAERATRISPDYPGAWRALGAIHHELGDAAKAIAAYDRQIALDPGPDAALDRCTIALDVSDFDTVHGLCRRVMGTTREADAFACLGMAAYREHRHEDAIALYDQALMLGCRDQPVMRWNKSLAMHSIGRYREAWVEHENRENQKTNPALYLPMRRFTLPRWRGEPPFEGGEDVLAKPKVLHVHYEAGAGDNLCLSRYLRLAKDLGFRVRFECADEMVDLMRSSFPDVEILPKAADYPGALGIKPFDYHCPTGSLPAVFETDVDTVPWFGPYLKPDPILVDRFRAKLRSKEGRPRARVGVCWSSGIRDQGVWMREYGLRKSMHFSDIELLVGDVDLEWVSLQVGPERSQNYGVAIDVLPERPTWGETAALVANLDLVITVDTAVAHLAGAMGKPVWVMAQRDAASWHFMCWRPGASWNEVSPWYPSARVFRQRTFDRPRYWGDVVADVGRALDAWPERNRAKEAESA